MPLNPTHAGDDKRFGQELKQDMALACAQGFFDADLPGSLLHRDQHDIH